MIECSTDIEKILSLFIVKQEQKYRQFVTLTESQRRNCKDISQNKTYRKLMSNLIVFVSLKSINFELTPSQKQQKYTTKYVPEDLEIKNEFVFFWQKTMG